MSWLPVLIVVIVVYAIANVVVRRLGIASSLDSDSLERLLARRNASLELVDVRSAAEYEAGHIPSAVNIPHNQIAENPPSTDRERLVVLYCQTGSRSAIARSRLRREGFSNVVNFGSIRRWKGELVQGAEPGHRSSSSREESAQE